MHVPRVEHSNAEISDMRDLVATQLQSKETTKSCEALFFAGDIDVFCEAFLWVKRLGGIPHPRIRTFLLLSMMVAKPLPSCRSFQSKVIKAGLKGFKRLAGGFHCEYFHVFPVSAS